jgi:hypothetical protein
MSQVFSGLLLEGKVRNKIIRPAYLYLGKNLRPRKNGKEFTEEGETKVTMLKNHHKACLPILGAFASAFTFAFAMEAVPGVTFPGKDGEAVHHAPAAIAQALRLDQNANDCVAQDPAAGICLLTVDAFNRALEHRTIPLRQKDPDFPTQSDIDAIRGEVLRQILGERYFTAAPIPARDKDSLSALADATVFKRNQALRDTLGEATLRAAYRELFPTVFRGKEEPLFEVLASTDSLRLDSLRSAPDSSVRSAWWIVPEAELPAEALHAARAVKSGAMAGPVRVPFGYLFLREVSRRRHPDVSMDAALPLLISRASIPAEGEPGWEKDMEDFYRQHPESFITPDTLTYRAWLLPQTGHRAVSRRLPRMNKVRMQMQKMDTVNTNSITVHEKDLPRGLREDLSDFPPCRRGEALGPISSVFGTWYLLALEVRNGGRSLTMEESRHALGKRVYGWEGPEFLLPAVADAQARERDIRKAITTQYLMTRKTDDKTAGDSDNAIAGPAEAGKAGSAIPWESKRDDWMRNHLVLRFVELPEPGAFPFNASAPGPDSSWSDGAENARFP